MLPQPMYNLGQTVKYEIDRSTRKKCKYCGGKGRIPTLVKDTPQDCRACDGYGWKNHYQRKVKCVGTITSMLVWYELLDKNKVVLNNCQYGIPNKGGTDAITDKDIISVISKGAE